MKEYKFDNRIRSSAELAFKSRREFGDWDSSFEDEQPKKAESTIPLLENGWASFGEYRLVGNGEVTNQFCGRWACYKGCMNVEKHDIVDLHGRNYSGLVYVEPVLHSCNRPSCPICYKSGWAVREAHNIECRLKEAAKRFGVIEHLCISVPSKDYGLKLPHLRKKVIKMLTKIGVIGASLIWHGFRYSLQKQWYWSPHFHVLGFILGGYSRCRHCKGADCYACDGGFDGKTYKLYRENGYVVKVFGERKTIFGTAWYQLNHASYKVGVKRFHIATWFGVVSYRKLKVTVEKRKRLCPICQDELIRITYSGSFFFVKNKDAADFRRFFFADYEEEGVPVWSEYVKPKFYGSGSYDY